MTQQEIHDAVLQFLRLKVLYDEKKVIPDEDSFLGSGILDSTGILELIGFLEETFDLKFLDDELVADNFDSLNRVARFVATKLGLS
jgi:acyl carrier protein